MKSDLRLRINSEGAQLSAWGSRPGEDGVGPVVRNEGQLLSLPK